MTTIQDPKYPMAAMANTTPTASTADTANRTLGECKLILQYGGQGIRYWDELKALYAASSEARALIDLAADALLADSSSEHAKASPAFERELDMKSWLKGGGAEKSGGTSGESEANESGDAQEVSTDVPWERACFSYPLIALTQAANYAVLLARSGSRHEDVVNSASCAIGHSQGVVSAVVLAAARTDEEFSELSVQLIRYMYWHGLRAQEVFDGLLAQRKPTIKSNSETTPMLAVQGLSRANVENAIKTANRRSKQNDLQLSLVNAPEMFCVTGLPATLLQLKQTLEALLTKADENQTRVPFSQRKPFGSLSFVRLSCPFHSTMLVSARERILEDIARVGVKLTGAQLQIPVYSTTSDSANLQELGDGDITPLLVDMQLTQLADWVATLKAIALNHSDATHVLDFGPDRGASGLSSGTLEGLGIEVVVATTKHEGLATSGARQAPLWGLSRFLETASAATKVPSWESKFAPRVDATGKIANKFTRTLKKPPVIVAGMTPTTSLSGVGLVAAVMNSGFVGELAAGGLPRPNLFEDTISQLVTKVQPGRGVVINMLYLNAKQWGFQFPMVLHLRKSGVPIESITIGAGIPTKERALEIMADLASAGIKAIGFKPGSINGIHAVLEIARATPSMSVMLQWTGGRAGGHHSFEDFHQPLVASYAAIRRVENVLLVVGSGFGSWEDSHQYLTGEWSLSRGAAIKMPVDAILLGSRVMVAKEAATAEEVKQLLVATPGVESEVEWEQSYTCATGGIVTVTSELGEPIHVLANRGGLLWKEFDDKYFSKPREELALAVRLDRDEIIARVNADFQKPYFGIKEDWETGETRSAELDEMTYGEVLSRLIELMFVDIAGRAKRWIHESFCDRVGEFMTRSEQRFQRKQNASSVDQSQLKTNPRSALKSFVEAFPQVTTTLLTVADCAYFVNLCRTGGKPVNFIPVIDGDLKEWFKKDSLWYSEDLDAAPGRDAQRVCVLQGPVAVRYSTVANEPVGKILGDIVAGFTTVVTESGAVESALSSSVPLPVEVAGFAVVERDNELIVTIPESAKTGDLPIVDAWLSALLPLVADKQWLADMISSAVVVEGNRWVANPIRELLRPRAGQTLSFGAHGLEIVDASLALCEPVIRVFSQDCDIVVRISEFRPQIAELKEDVVVLDLKFAFVPESVHTIHSQTSESSTEAMKAFYARFWVAEEGREAESCNQAREASVLSSFTDEFTVTEDAIVKFKASVGLNTAEVSAPVDFSTVVAWKALIKSVFAKEVGGNLLNLVHLKHSYSMVTTKKANELFAAGDTVVSVSNVTGLRIIESGRIVSAAVLVSRRILGDDNEMEEILEPLVELRSEFLIRGSFSDFASTFAASNSVERLTLNSEFDVRLLSSKSWFALLPDAAPLAIGDTLELELSTKTQFATTNQLSYVRVSGSVSRVRGGALVHIADVAVESTSANASPVDVCLQQVRPKGGSNGSMFTDGGRNMLEKPREIQVPWDALAYAVASRDLNPIHRSNYVATLAKLPNGKPIMHGMWTATKVRALVVEGFGSGIDTNVVEFDVSFDGMVYPSETLFMQARHIGQKTGNKLLSVEVVNKIGERVVSARAEVKQPPMAFVFTGQGSAEIGMGMERYLTSAAARAIWDRGDAHLRETFGFSILEIVRKNPTSLTIHFGGTHGRQIRANFMALASEDPVSGRSVSLLPEITTRTQSFTFSAPEGLLFATQFNQPALVLLEKAAFSEVEAAGLVTNDALFAGHSLGEYAALSAFAEALAVEDVVEIVFLRGLIMQKSVKRDASGRSDYAMVAANPSRVGAFFTAATLLRVVRRIADVSNKLLQVVNYNVQGLQYVVAGDTVNLEALSTSLSMLKALEASADLEIVVKESLEQAAERKRKCARSGKPFVLARGVATIPLPGIDVPFHSAELLGGVPSFRALLRTKFDPRVLERQLPLLVDRYIPNLVATPFSLDRSYFELVHAVTGSPYIAEVLDPVQWELTTQAQRVHLLLVELLAYQFASPVQWIKTQALLFSLSGAGVSRFVEIGPAPTLTNMALRTLQVGHFADVPREILWYQRDRDAVHFEEENSNPSASEYARALVAEAPAVRAAPVVEEAAAVPVVSAAVAPTISMPPVVWSPPAVAVEDASVAALHVLCVLLAVRLNKNLSEISAGADVKTLCAGKSAVQNEILGDMEKEFDGGVPDGAAEVPLKELASKFSGYSRLGKVTTGLIAKMLAGKMPGGFTMSSVKEYLSSVKALGPGRSESVLAHSLVLAPKTRLKSKAEAQKWLDASVESYASFAGVSLATPVTIVPQAGLGAAFAPAVVSIPSVADQPVDAKHTLKVLLAAKFGRNVSDITDASTIKELSGGRSALQNEIVGDLETEFGTGPDDAAETQIADLAAKFPRYASPGKVTSALIAKLLAGKMPGGFGLSPIKEHLGRERCLPVGRIEGVLLHSLTHNPKQRLADAVQAKKWLDDVTDAYAAFCGIDIPYLSRLGMSARGVGTQPMQAAATSLPIDFEQRLKAMIRGQVDALNEFLGVEPLDMHKRVETEVELREQLEVSVAQWVAEHGEEYSNGIAPLFDARKEREYDSFWNWAVQDAVELFYCMLRSSADSSHSANTLPVGEQLARRLNAMSRWISTKPERLAADTAPKPLEELRLLLCNRATPELLQCTRFFAHRVEAEGDAEHAQAMELLAEHVESSLSTNPVNLQHFTPTQPQLRILDTGELEYSEVPRIGVSDAIDYVDELARGLAYHTDDATMSLAPVFATTVEMVSAVDFEPALSGDGSSGDGSSGGGSSGGDNESEGEAGGGVNQQQQHPVSLPGLTESTLRKVKGEELGQLVALPHVHVRKPSVVDPTIQLVDVEATRALLASMREMATTGVSFAGKVALVTGCSKHSIGAEVVKALLEGGAVVLATTSSFSTATAATFRALYEQHGSRGSRLVLLPFNQASVQDVKALVAHIYGALQLDVDFVVPFAAAARSEAAGRTTLGDIDARAELAHRIMLTNTLRLLGEVVRAKKSRGVSTRPALALLPLSPPTHGTFGGGGDGLYAESKLGIASLLRKWRSEGWREQLSVVGAVIGWTRGTGLTTGNDVVAQGVEALGVRTFSATETGFNLSALLHPDMVDRAADAPLLADLTGGMAQLTDLDGRVDRIRADLAAEAELRASVFQAEQQAAKTLLAPLPSPLPPPPSSSSPSSSAAATDQSTSVREPSPPRANLSRYLSESFPRLSLAAVRQLAASREQTLLRGMVDLRQVVVVAGFGEVGPWGNARTRWEMESFGTFSLEGCVELAWLTGRIAFADGGWVDAATRAPVDDRDVKARYEADMLAHAGIRVLEPELFDGYDPHKKTLLHQVAIAHNMAPVEVADRDEALAFRRALGADNVDVFPRASSGGGGDGAWMIRLRKGAVLSIPRALAFDRFVAAQIPTGWSAERLGLPRDIAASVDPVTLYTLAATADALVAAGVTDPYEFYQYVHVSAVGNASGGGMGGARAYKRVYQHRLLHERADVASDTLNECFINTAPAWVNMLLLSSSGPIKTPVGACATAAESVDVAVETIKSGKARVVVAGGNDDLSEESAFEFAQMRATSDSAKEVAAGRAPAEMSRPCASSSAGFMESHGAGMQLLMDAQLALDMGCPIYGVVAFVSTATDKIGRSVPAPGQGILTTAREVRASDATATPTPSPSPLLDVAFRRRQFDGELAAIDRWYAREVALVGSTSTNTSTTVDDSDDDAAAKLELLRELKACKVQAAQALWGERFFVGRTDVAPLRGALAAWNLHVDDLGCASFHGTGTDANDANEAALTQTQLAHLGRARGNPLPVVCQKHLTGHPKGAAAAWMLNGLLQALDAGVVPGNRSLDNVRADLRRHDLLVFPNRSVQTPGIRAALLKSFGFGQAGAEVLLVHPDRLLALLADRDLQRYAARRRMREARMSAYTQRAMAAEHPYIPVKHAAPYSDAQETAVLLDPTARAQFDPATRAWRFGSGRAPRTGAARR